MDCLIEPSRKIWIVDDSKTDAERVRDYLSSDYDVEVMHDGAIALERLSTGDSPDLLLLDWVMPEISGLEVCKYVRSSPGKISQVPVILLTANQESADIVQAFRAGANDYVSKPFVGEELKARVSVLMESKRLLERAEKAEADLRTLLSTAPDPIFAIDVQGKITFVNNEGVQAIGTPRESIVGRSFSKSFRE